MEDALFSLFLNALPEELASLLKDAVDTTAAGDFCSLLQFPDVQILLGHRDIEATKGLERQANSPWTDYVLLRLNSILARQSDESMHAAHETEARRQHFFFFIVAFAALNAFVQSAVCGPPLRVSSADMLFPKEISGSTAALRKTRAELVASLGADGIAAYRLAPNIELLCLASTILKCPLLQKVIDLSAWLRLRINFIQQRLLSEPAPSLQTVIYEDLNVVEKLVLKADSDLRPKNLLTNFLLERAAIHTHHGLDRKARRDLEQATIERKFEFALTGWMGKRTKFQQNDISQLLVLACSAGDEKVNGYINQASQPKAIDLNDDTLLESVRFAENTVSLDAKDQHQLSARLNELDPSNQPMLEPLDSIILLSLAESIRNTNPVDGLTREETAPYAIRVLEGGSSNWQVYTQALLIRSRIEGYRSRTMERGLLQLQALVDQVIAETSDEASIDAATSERTASFLPRAKMGESASVTERLQYICLLCSPSRWELEAELAARWVSVGGLRSALDIYERLEMWAEAALCYAATDKEGKARKMIRKQLFHATKNDEVSLDDEVEAWEGPAKDPPPAEAPRYYCILGDMDKDLSMYEKAWEVSGKRYARAQRSLGQNYMAQHDYPKAVEAYSLSLKVNALCHPSWFALGCAHLQLQGFKKAAEAFSRCVQLDDQDAEAWSNLAASLLHLRPKTDAEGKIESKDADDEVTTSHPRTDALRAFKRAASLKHDNQRIWSNVLTVAASTQPPCWSDVVAAQRRICEICGSSDGEKCVDVQVMGQLVQHVIRSEPDFDVSRPGLARLANELMEKYVKPLITSSSELWNILGTMYLHSSRPSSALACHEKAWRAVTSQPKWESGTEAEWNVVIERSIDLVDAYETLGPRERCEGLAAGSGELVAKDWRFKARSAIRSVMGKGRANWEDSEGWSRLQERLDELASSG